MTTASIQSISSPWPMTRVRALRSEVAWSWSARDCFLRDTIVTPSQILVPMREGLVALCLETGQQRWRWHGTIVRRGGLWQTSRHVVVQHSASRLQILDASNGSSCGSIEIPHLHRALHSIELDAPTPGVLLLGERGTTALLDARTHAIIWLNEGGTRGPAQYAWREDTLLILQGNQLQKVCAHTGEVRWCIQTRRSARDVCMHADRAVLLHAGAQRAQTIVRGIDLETGRVLEEVSLDGYFLGTSASIGEDLWLVLERHRRPVVEILRGPELSPAWLRPFQEQRRSISPSLTPLPSELDESGGVQHVMIQTGTSEVVVMESTQGEVVWRDMQEPLLRAPLHALMTPGACFCLGGDALLVRRGDTGEVMHRFDQFIDEPCLMQSMKGEALSVLLGESPIDDGESTLMRVNFSPALRIAYDSRHD